MKFKGKGADQKGLLKKKKGGLNLILKQAVSSPQDFQNFLNFVSSILKFDLFNTRLTRCYCAISAPVFTLVFELYQRHMRPDQIKDQSRKRGNSEWHGEVQSAQPQKSMPCSCYKQMCHVASDLLPTNTYQICDVASDLLYMSTINRNLRHKYTRQNGSVPKSISNGLDTPLVTVSVSPQLLILSSSEWTIQQIIR